MPGLVDAHCHLGLDDDGATDDADTEQQAVEDRDGGALLIRDAGSAADTRWVHEREDLPRLIRAGRHIGRTKRYIRNYAHEVEPDELAAVTAQEARAATAGSSSSGTGSPARRVTSRRRSPRRPSRPRSRPRTTGRPGHGALLRGRGAPRAAGRGHRLHRARDRAVHRPDRADGRPGRGPGPTVMQLGEVPGVRRGGRRALPDVRRDDDRPARAHPRHPDGGLRRRRRDLRRLRRGRHQPARQRRR